MCHRRAARSLRARTAREGHREGGTEGGRECPGARAGEGAGGARRGRPAQLRAGRGFRAGVSRSALVSWESLGRSARHPGGPVGCCGQTRAGGGRASRSFPVIRRSRRRALGSRVAGTGGEHPSPEKLPRAQVSRGRRGGGLCPACSFLLCQLPGAKARGSGRFSRCLARAAGGITPAARLLLAAISDVRCWELLHSRAIRAVQ